MNRRLRKSIPTLNFTRYECQIIERAKGRSTWVRLMFQEHEDNLAIEQKNSDMFSVKKCKWTERLAIPG